MLEAYAHTFLAAFNYWEPLHLLAHAPWPLGTAQSPFQTWEYSPQYAIRSWAYVAQYLPVASWLPALASMEKVSPLVRRSSSLLWLTTRVS